jgi:antagonist of KipI
MRGYFCVRGGLHTPAVLGSRSALEPLAAGAELPCQPGRIHARYVHDNVIGESADGTLRVLPGPQADWCRAPDFFDRHSAFAVTPASDRMGVRLQGEPVPLPVRELVSEPVCPGTVQVTPDGQCILLGVDGQTIGGYPKIAQVISADLDQVGQLRPGDRVRFQRVEMDEAERVYRERQALLHEWVTRLRTAELFGA